MSIDFGLLTNTVLSSASPKTRSRSGTDPCASSKPGHDSIVLSNRRKSPPVYTLQTNGPNSSHLLTNFSFKNAPKQKTDGSEYQLFMAQLQEIHKINCQIERTAESLEKKSKKTKKNNEHLEDNKRAHSKPHKKVNASSNVSGKRLKKQENGPNFSLFSQAKNLKSLLKKQL